MKKACTQCAEVKSLSEYYITHKPGRGPSYKSACKKCCNERNAALIRRKRLKKAQGGDPAYQAYQRQYYRDNIEKFKKYRKNFIERNPDYFRIKSRDRTLKLKLESLIARTALNERDST